MVFLISAMASVLAYILFEILLGSLFNEKIKLMQRLDEVHNLERLRDGENEHNISIGRQIVNAVSDRILGIFELLIPRNQEALKSIEMQLKMAGMSMTPLRYNALLLSRIFFGALFGLVLGFLLGSDFSTRLLLVFLGLVSGYSLSRFGLKSKIRKRKEDIYHQLPEVMDLLSVSVAAGLAFDQAVSYVVEKGEGPLIEELDITRKEMTLGVKKREALESLARRCDNTEIRTFATAVTQAEEMGASLQNILRVQATTIRETHKQNVEERAQKLPIQMLLPLIIFVFPTLFIVILGPVAVSITALFGGS